MSYTQSYSTSITVSGSKQVYVSARERGGYETVSYSETVPIYVDIYVETTPFDESVFNSELKVDGLTDSVVLMNGAQCATINDSSRQISEHLTDGFYSMIRTDISMKQTENFSELQARTALLLELSKDTATAHQRMEEDITRLRRHYGEIFQGLNDDLEKRIQELDKPAFALSQKAKRQLLVEPVTTMGAATAEAISSTDQMAGRISIARMKKQISSALLDISESVKKSMSYKTKIGHILSTSDEGDTEFVPVVYTRSAKETGRQFSFFAPKMKGAESAVAKVSEYVGNAGNERWSRLKTEEQGMIDREFTNLVEAHSKNASENSEYNSRVHAEILNLWNRNKRAMTEIYRERQEQ